MAVVSALLLAVSAGCYNELDFNHIECDVNSNGTCPGGYVCSAGLCVKGTEYTPDAALADSGAATVSDGPSADQVVVGVDATVGEVGPADVASFPDASGTIDVWAAIDSPQEARRTVDVEVEDLRGAIDVASDVALTDTPVLDSSLPDTRPDVVDTAPDVSTIGTEIRTIESFRIPTANVVPTSIIAGPDGNLWFAEYKTKNIGRVTTAGQIKEFPTPSGADTLVVGADNNIWYTAAGGLSLGRFNPISAEVSEFSLAGIAMASWITSGPDGNLWFTDYPNGQIGKMTTAGVATMYPIDAYPMGITKGADGNLWYGCDKGIGRISTDGRDKLFSPLLNGVQWSAEVLTVGGDQRLWFTFSDLPGRVGAMTTAGEVTDYPMNLQPSLRPYSHSIIAGPDGNVWFADSDGLVRITPSGVVTVFLMPEELRGPDYLTIGPDGYIWFTDQDANRIGRMRI